MDEKRKNNLKVWGVIGIALIMAIGILAEGVFGLTLNPGECITINGTEICSQNTTACPGAVCEYSNCSAYINENISSTLSVCLDIYGQLGNFSASLGALNSTVLGLDIVTDYSEKVGELENCSIAKNDAISRLGNLGACGVERDEYKSKYDQCSDDLGNKDAQITGLTTNNLASNTNIYATAILCLVAGAGGCYFYFKKMDRTIPGTDVSEGEKI